MFCVDCFTGGKVNLNEHYLHPKRLDNVPVHNMQVELDNYEKIHLSVNKSEETLNLQRQKHESAFLRSSQLQQLRLRQPILY